MTTRSHIQALTRGCPVVVQGLTGATQYNGLLGQVAGDPQASGRIPVCLMEDPSDPAAPPRLLTVRPSNLKRCAEEDDARMAAFDDPDAAEPRLRRGAARMANGNLRGAVLDLQAAVGLGGGLPRPDRARAQAELAAAAAALHEQQESRGETMSSDAVGLDPNDERLKAMHGGAHDGPRCTSIEALSGFSREMQLGQLMSLMCEALDYADDGNFEQAVPCLGVVLLMAVELVQLPTAVEALAVLSNARVKQRMPRAALVTAQLAVKLATGTEVAMCDLRRMGDLCDVGGLMAEQQPDQEEDEGTSVWGLMGVACPFSEYSVWYCQAMAFMSLGVAHATLEANAEAVHAYRQAETVLSYLPKGEAVSSLKANLHMNISNRLLQEGHIDASMKELSIGKQYRAEVPEEEGTSSVEAEAFVLYRQGRAAEALALLEDAFRSLGSDGSAGEKKGLARCLTIMNSSPEQQHRWLSEFLQQQAAWQRAPVPTTCTVCSLEFRCDPRGPGLPEVHITGCGHAFHESCFFAGRNPISGTINCPLCKAPCVVNTHRAVRTGPEGDVVPLRRGKEQEDMEDLAALRDARAAVQARRQATSSHRSPAAAAAAATAPVASQGQEGPQGTGTDTTAGSPGAGSSRGRSSAPGTLVNGSLPPRDLEEYLPPGHRQFLGGSSSRGRRRNKKNRGGRPQRSGGVDQQQEQGEDEEPDPFQGLPALPRGVLARHHSDMQGEPHMDDECAVCLEPLGGPCEKRMHTLVRLPACGHVYHEFCWRNFMASKISSSSSSSSRRAGGAPVLRCCLCREPCTY